MELSKNDSKMLQGLSVLAMLCLHLFCRMPGDTFTPLVTLFGMPLSYYFGQMGDFCVFGFAMLSGYAHWLLYSKQEPRAFWRGRLKSLIPLVINYWLILVLFTIASVVTGHADFMPGDVWTFVRHVFLIGNTYNGAWWYLLTFIIIVVVSPLILKAVKKWHPAVTILLTVLIYAGFYFIRFYAAGLLSSLGDLTGICDRIGRFGTTLAEYLAGVLICRFAVFTKLYGGWKRIPCVLRWVIAVLLLAGMTFAHTKISRSLALAPFTGFVVMTLFHFWRKPRWIQAVFVFIGNHSTNLWLTHMFFFNTLFKNLVYAAKYPPLIFLFLLAVTLACSLVLTLIMKPIRKALAGKSAA